MLNMKPVLHVDDEGKLVAVGKMRGRKRALDDLVKRMGEQIGDYENKTFFISHGDCLADAEYVRDQVKEKFGISDCLINFVGPSIGAHSGPGTIAFFISHGDCLADAEYVRDQVKEKFGISDCLINFVGPSIGAHSGPGTIALFFLGKQR